MVNKPQELPYNGMQSDAAEPRRWCQALCGSEMGLDTVEFILETEEEFSIRISDSEAEKIGKVGELAKFIVTRVKKEQGKELQYENVLKGIIDKLVENYAIERDIIHPGSHFVRDLRLD